MWVWGSKVKNVTIFFNIPYPNKASYLIGKRWLRSFEEVINVILFLRPTTYDERAQRMTNGIRTPA